MQQSMRNSIKPIHLAHTEQVKEIGAIIIIIVLCVNKTGFPRLGHNCYILYTSKHYK